MPIDVTFTLSDAMVNTLQRLNSANNVVRESVGLEALTVQQYFRERTREWVDSESQRLFDVDNARLKEALNKATPEESATVHSILDKYLV